ncbi:MULTISPECIES: hypothetical protein [unclassified Bradyrhizobium]|uniref:hypothetical protein n=1 Tax=unclassified Bradyrhizobium TaxID=2631580 RepID=UPI0028EA89F4|nr:MULTISPECIES: hypothetical protein [unclassified Bradyrhizobium]
MAHRIDVDDAIDDADGRAHATARRQTHIRADGVSPPNVADGLISAAIDAAECRGIASTLSAGARRYNGA